MKIKTLREIYSEGRKPTKEEIYDAKVTHSGFGAPNCTCHVSPPCQNCVDWTNYCDERQNEVENLKEPGCYIIKHDCPIGRGEVRA